MYDEVERDYDDFCNNIVSKFEYVYLRTSPKIMSIIVTIGLGILGILLSIHTFLSKFKGGK